MQGEVQLACCIKCRVSRGPSPGDLDTTQGNAVTAADSIRKWEVNRQAGVWGVFPILSLKADRIGGKKEKVGGPSAPQ